MPVTINNNYTYIKTSLAPMKLLQLIRFQDLLLIAFTQLIFRYGFFEMQPDMPLALNQWQYILLVLSCGLIAAGGFLINNILDRNNTIEMTEGKAYNIYAGLNIAGVGIAFYLANAIGKPSFSAVFIVVAATLYLYASTLRQSLLIGNILIALIVPLSILIVGVFDLYPVIIPENRTALGIIFELLLDYAFFIFIIVLLREIVKDIRDTDADYNSGRSTLPIVLGRERAAKVAFIFTLLPLGLLLYYANAYMLNLLIALVYGLLLIVGPLIYFAIKIWTAKTPRDFGHLSLVLKLVLFFTALSIVVVTFNIFYNA
jgi:4-hydroxybenzoate polyprenyltransferase